MPPASLLCVIQSVLGSLTKNLRRIFLFGVASNSNIDGITDASTSIETVIIAYPIPARDAAVPHNASWLHQARKSIMAQRVVFVFSGSSLSFRLSDMLHEIASREGASFGVLEKRPHTWVNSVITGDIWDTKPMSLSDYLIQIRQ